MEFQEFTITNYKGIREAKFKLGNLGFSNICTLIGLNESGKTTLLEALHTFYIGFIPEQYHDDTPKEVGVLDPYDFIPRSEVSNFNDSVQIVGTFSYSMADMQHLISEAADLDYEIKFPATRKMTATVEYIYEKSKFIKMQRQMNDNDIMLRRKRSKKWINIYEVKYLWKALEQCVVENLPEIIYYPDFAFDFPDRIYLEPFEDESKESKFYRNFIQDVLDSLEENYSIETHIIERVRDRSGRSAAALRQTMRRLQESIRDLIFRSDFSVFKSNEISIDAGIPIFDNDRDAYYIEIKIDQDGEFYSINERSKGFRWFFSFILLTQFRAHRILGKYPVFLIDEPASNLHPSAQQKLLKAFEEIGEFYKGSVVYSTHSHYLINPLWLENSYVVINESVNYNEITASNKFSEGIKIYHYRRFVNDFPSKTDYLQVVLDILKYQPSQLDKISNPLIVEGKSDFYILKKISEQIGYDISIIPALGAGSALPIISLYIGWGRKYLLLLDDDEEGKKQKVRYTSSGIASQRIKTFGELDKEFAGYEIEDFMDDEFKELIGLNKKASKKEIAGAIYSICSSGRDLPTTQMMQQKFKKLFSKIVVNLKDETY